MTRESVQEDQQPAPARPTEYTREIGMTICERLFEDESLRAICTDPVMPDKATVLSWISHNEEFRETYAAAREFQAHCISDDAIDVADNASGDWVEKVGANGRVVSAPDRKNLPRCRLRCEVRFWVASELLACVRKMSSPAKKVGWCTPPLRGFTFPVGGFPPDFTPKMKGQPT